MSDHLRPDRIRIDKWLWAARFFKTRAQAARACELGRVECCGQPLKPSREVHVGDRLRVKTETGEFQIEVSQLSHIRGPAKVAQTLYAETEASKELRLKLAEERKSMPRLQAFGDGRLSKRDRREWNRLRDRL
jgi:ribosome-associated heat shock protein Hsp15